MLSFLPGFLLGPISLSLIIANTVIWGVPLFIFSFLKMALPFTFWRTFWTAPVLFVTETWASINVALCRFVLKIEWDTEVNAELDYQGSYLVLPNHQSWSDIIFLHSVLNGKVPFLRFFLKQELIWVPILSVAWIALDFPFMKRYTKEQLAKKPELKGTDIETTKKSCEKFKDMPVAITNFLEGTRFTQEKHDRQNSPYTYLLKPKSGGIAFALSVMEGKITQLLDVTIAYPRGNSGIWDLMSGKLTKVVIRVNEKRIPDEVLFGDYENDKEFRVKFQSWVTEHWQEKDALIAELMERK